MIKNALECLQLSHIVHILSFEQEIENEAEFELFVVTCKHYKIEIFSVHDAYFCLRIAKSLSSDLSLVTARDNLENLTYEELRTPCSERNLKQECM